jgi:hypothetical protein
LQAGGASGVEILRERGVESVDGELQVGKGVELVGCEVAVFGGALDGLEAFAQR